MAKQKPYDYDQVLTEIAGSNPRISALLAGVLVNELALVAVKFNLISLSKKDEKALFEGYGPLSSFSALIDVGYGMGLFSDKLRHDLNVIRRLRNYFAHNLDNSSLDVPEFRDQILSLNALQDADQNKASNELLREAVEKMAMYLISRTAPSSLKFDSDFCNLLRPLGFSSLSQAKRRYIRLN